MFSTFIHTNIIVKPAACRKLYCETFKKGSKMNEKALLALEKANRIRLLDTERESVAAFFARADADFEAFFGVISRTNRLA